MTIAHDPMNFLKDVTVRLSIELGSTQLPLREVMALGEESVIVLDRLTDELLDVQVNGRRIARGEVVVQGGRFGLRIVEMEGHAPLSAAPAAADAPAIAAEGML